MAFDRPSTSDLDDIAHSYGFRLSTDELLRYREMIEGVFREYDVLEGLREPAVHLRYERQAGYKPDRAEDSLGAWHRKSRIDGAVSGPLHGRTLVLKDNIAIAGVPMANGSAPLDGFVPERDATVVTRILDAGGTILGKAVCEHLCMSGGSHTSDSGPVHNPHRPGYSAGGSSSGCGALVAGGEVDMAIGGDQGGSIRIPSAYCGIYGMKPTHGLVPYTGIMPIEATIDHAGPMTRSVADNALLLSVVAGFDGLDPRQIRSPPAADYAASLGRGVAGLRIGLLDEGFTVPGMDPNVALAVEAAANRLRTSGARLEHISIPAHRDAFAVWTAVAVEGLTMQMMRGDGTGFNWKGAYDPALMKAHSAWREQPDRLSPTLKLAMLAGGWSLSRHGGRVYARAQNLARVMRAEVDAAFERFDLLLMPTVPRVASPLPASDADLSDIIERANELNVSTAPFDLTGHPAMSVPCGLSDGLPVGMMLIGPHFGEATIYRAAAAFEAEGDWRTF